MSSSSSKSCSSCTMRNIQRFQLCSTPVEGEKYRLPSSTSVSTIERNSSSSMIARRALLSKQLDAGRYEGETRGKKRQKQRTKQSRKKVKAKISSDSDWETNSEQFINEEPSSARISQQTASTPGYSFLFKDTYGSPERVREVRYLLNDDRLEAPLFVPRRKELDRVEGINFEGEILPSKDASSLRTRVYDFNEEDSEEELVLMRRSTDQTYKNKRQLRRFNINMKIKEQAWNDECLGPIRYQTATADLLWSNFLEEIAKKKKKQHSLAPE